MATEIDNEISVSLKEKTMKMPKQRLELKEVKGVLEVALKSKEEHEAEIANYDTQIKKLKKMGEMKLLKS
ncbi:MAG: hypothetical protein Q9M43_10660 [Sulfurimonas sp.]|nr:hypothetical protein [Sulfurimonas sp.]